MSTRPLLCAAILALPLGASCSHESAAPAASPAGASKSRTELAVYAAASTRDVLQALEPAYETTHDVDLVFNFASSSDLAKQIVAAGKADVFLSADDKSMDDVEKAGLVASGSRSVLLSNQLVVIEPLDGTSVFTTPFAPAQIADARHVSLANVESVPAGRYAKAWLEKVGAWKAVEPEVVPAVDVRAALAAVESGGARAGIVYATDVARSKKARTVFTVPRAEGPKIVYPLAVIARRPSEPAARAFAAFLGSDATARAAFESAGFVVATPQ